MITKYESNLSIKVKDIAETNNKIKNNIYLFVKRKFGIKKYMLKYTAEITTGRVRRQ